MSPTMGRYQATTKMCDSASMVVTEADCRTPPATCSGRSRVSGNTAQVFSSASVTSRRMTPGTWYFEES